MTKRLPRFDSHVAAFHDFQARKEAAARAAAGASVELIKTPGRSFRLIAPGGAWVGPGLGLFPTEAAARLWAAREGYSVKASRPFDLAPREAPKGRAAGLWAAFALAPIKAPQEAPLRPSHPALARLAAIHAGAF